MTYTIRVYTSDDGLFNCYKRVIPANDDLERKMFDNRVREMQREIEARKMEILATTFEYNSDALVSSSLRGERIYDRELLPF